MLQKSLWPLRHADFLFGLVETEFVGINVLLGRPRNVIICSAVVGLAMYDGDNGILSSDLLSMKIKIAGPKISSARSTLWLVHQIEPWQPGGVPSTAVGSTCRKSPHTRPGSVAPGPESRLSEVSIPSVRYCTIFILLMV